MAEDPQEPQEPLSPTSGVRFLEVRLMRARDLPKMDKMGKADPYVKLTIGDKTQKSKIVKKSLAPAWNEIFRFKVNGLSETLILDVYDKDKFKKDDFIGKVVLPLEKVRRARKAPTWWKLRDASDQTYVEGEIRLKITMSRNEEQPERKQEEGWIHDGKMELKEINEHVEDIFNDHEVVSSEEIAMYLITETSAPEVMGKVDEHKHEDPEITHKRDEWLVRHLSTCKKTLGLLEDKQDWVKHEVFAIMNDYGDDGLANLFYNICENDDCEEEEFNALKFTSSSSHFTSQELADNIRKNFYNEPDRANAHLPRVSMDIEKYDSLPTCLDEVAATCGVEDGMWVVDNVKELFKLYVNPYECMERLYHRKIMETLADVESCALIPDDDEPIPEQQKMGSRLYRYMRSYKPTSEDADRIAKLQWYIERTLVHGKKDRGISVAMARKFVRDHWIVLQLGKRSKWTNLEARCPKYLLDAWDQRDKRIGFAELMKDALGLGYEAVTMAVITPYHFAYRMERKMRRENARSKRRKFSTALLMTGGHSY